MKQIYCLMIMLCFMMKGICQQTNALSIGDHMPSITLPRIMNNPVNRENINAYKGKLLILDFMSTGCVPCIRALPKLDSLQTRYKNQLQIILVTAEKEDRLATFLKRNPALHLPVLAKDTTLAKLFPHELISHIVWIDTAGIVKAITHSEYVNAKNIERALKERFEHWPVKRDITFYGSKQPMLQPNENSIPYVSMPQAIWYTTLTSFMPGIQKYNEVLTDSSKNIVHITLVNRSIIELYLLLFHRYHFPMSQVILQVKKPGRFVYSPGDGYYEDWKDNNCYCLDAILPGTIPQPVMQRKLIGDLNFYLGLQGRIQQRSVDCLVLRNKKDTKVKRSFAKGGLRVGMIAWVMNEKVNGIPVLDETNGTTYTTLPITEEQVADNAYLRNLLDDYGLELVTEKRNLEFLVITEPDARF